MAAKVHITAFLVYLQHRKPYMGVVIRQSIKGTIANYVGIAIGFITTFFILTHYLTQEEIGLTRVLVDASVLLAGLAQLGTNSSMLRFFPYFKDKNTKDHGIFFWSLIVPFIGFLIYLILFLAFKDMVIKQFADNSPLFVNYFYFIIPLSFSMLYLSVFETNANILMRISVPKMIREVGIRLGLLVSYILFGLKIIDLDALVIAYCIIYFLAAVINVIYVCSFGKVSFKPDFKFITPEIKRSFAFYTLFLILSALMGNITPLLNSFFVSAKMGLQYTGIFAIATYIATIIDIPSRSLSTIVQPQLSQAIKDNDIKAANVLLKKVSLHQLLAGILIFICLWINLDLIFNILPNGETYMSGKTVVCILSISRLLYSTFQIGYSVVGYSKYYYVSLFFAIILTTTAIILNNMLIPLWGMNGAACATLFSYAIYYGVILTVTWVKLKTSIFSINQLKVVFIAILLLAFNYLISRFVSSQCNISSLFLQIVEGIVRTFVVVAIGCTLIYKLKISEEVNHIADKILRIKK